MKQIFSLGFWKNGSCLVALILVLGVTGAGLTFWNYSRHVFSSHDGQVLNNKGGIVAFYPEQLVKKIEPHQRATVTFQGEGFIQPCKAEVLSTAVTKLGTNRLLLVTLQIITPAEPGKEVPWQTNSKIQAGVHCSVTIDASIPPQL